MDSKEESVVEGFMLQARPDDNKNDKYNYRLDCNLWN